MSDKRQVHTDALATLGTIIGPEEKRDAIHLAVIPMQAKEELKPGEHVDNTGICSPPYALGAVGIVDPFLKQVVKPGEWFWLVLYPRQITSLRHVWEHPAFPDEVPELKNKFEFVAKNFDFDDVINFLQIQKERGQQESKIEEKPVIKLGTGAGEVGFSSDVEKSKEWIAGYADELGEEVEELMAAAKKWVESKSGYDYYYGDGNKPDYYGSMGKFEGISTDPEFWHHYEIVTGTRVPEDRKENFFTCSC